MDRPRERLRARPTRWALGVFAILLLLVLLIGALAGRSALLAAKDLEIARAALAAADDGSADLKTVSRSVAGAQDAVAGASERLDSMPVRLLAGVPLAGRSFAAERAAVRVAGSTLAGVRLVVDAAPSLRTPGGVDLMALSVLDRELAPLAMQAAEDLAELRAQPLGLTPGPVRSGVEDAEAALAPVVKGLTRGSRGASVAAGVLGAGGPRKVLIALQNNAELQGTGGYVSSVATGRLVDGRLELDPFRPVEEVNDPPGRTRSVPAPPEYVEDFGPFLANTTLWRTWTMSPDVPDAAAVTANVAGELLGEKPDVVVLVDVPALAAFVALAGGELRLPDGEVVQADRLVDALLVDAYAETGGDVEEQLERRSALAAAAGERVPQLLAEDAAPLDVVRELGRLGRGRHLAIWSARELEQAALEDLDVAGSADPGGDDQCLISVNNLNANKLDYYIERSVSVEATVSRTQAEVLQRVVLRNRAPADLVPYVAGLETPGTATERVELSISPQADVTSLLRNGQPAPGGVRRGSERTRVHTVVELARGQEITVELRYTVPVVDGEYRLHLLPQPLARDAALDVTLTPAEGWRFDQVRGAQTLGLAVGLSGPWAEGSLLEVSVAEPERTFFRRG